MIHVSGVGLLGAFVLHQLQRLGRDFTWDDTETRFNAWSAATGAIIPCEDSDNESYAQGYRWWRNHAVGRAELQPFLEQVDTYYVMQNPPQRVTRKWEPILQQGNRIWKEDLPGWQFDTNRFVEETRAFFTAQRRESHKPGDWVLRARGVAEVISTPTVVWGWRVPAKISPINYSVFWDKQPLLPRRPVIHFNDPARPFERYYFHPRAGSPNVWWCGSEAVLQKAPRDAVERAYDGFAAYKLTAAKRFNLMLDVKYQPEHLVQGWRAKPRVLHKQLMKDGALCYETTPRLFVAMPLYKSGVQCGPWFADTIVQTLLKRGA